MSECKVLLRACNLAGLSFEQAQKVLAYCAEHGTPTPTAGPCSAVRAVVGGTNKPSEFRWCSPCGKLLKDEEPCFKSAATATGNMMREYAEMRDKLAAAQAELAVVKEELEQYKQDNGIFGAGA